MGVRSLLPWFIALAVVLGSCGALSGDGRPDHGEGGGTSRFNIPLEPGPETEDLGPAGTPAIPMGARCAADPKCRKAFQAFLARLLAESKDGSDDSSEDMPDRQNHAHEAVGEDDQRPVSGADQENETVPENGDDDGREETPETHPEHYENVRGTNAKRNKETGEIWVKDRLHNDHYEVYKDRRNFEKLSKRDRSVFEDGRLNEKF